MNIMCLERKFSDIVSKIFNKLTLFKKNLQQ
jgi:hypothetical protein